MGFKLDKKQLEAIQHGDGPLLIIAGAGTGKTTVITERIKYLILKKNVAPSEILALTFTEKASLEMEERVDRAMPYGYTQMWISTFHSFCDRILRQEAIHIGLNPSYKLLTEAETVLFLRKNLFKFDLHYFRPLGNPNKFLEALISHFSRLKDEDVSPSEYTHFVQNQKSRLKDNQPLAEKKEEIEKYLELAHAYSLYEELKTKEGVMDFADLISNTLTLLRTRKNILKNYQEQFKYVLVDEFQDTNYAQNQLAILLAADTQNITVVGDDDQSIYRFRGSSVSNIIQFKKQFPKTKIVTLTTNYRSTFEILNKSYTLIQNNNPDRLEIKEKINKKLLSARKIKGSDIEFIYAKRVEDEADFVAKKILQLPKYNYKDFAILVRANDHSENFVRAFQRLKIPYQFLGPGRLFHQEEIKNLIAYLKVLYNFEDSASLYRILNMPIFEFESIEIASLLNFARKRNYTLFQALEKVSETFLKEQTKEKIKGLVGMIKRHIGLIKKETGGQILYYFLKDSGILKKMIEETSEKEEMESKNIAKFFDKLKTYEVEHTSSSVYDIVDWIDLALQMGESPLATTTDWSEINAVNILTTHSSKGLEFPVVFLVNLVEGRFPSRERREAIPIPQDLIKEILPIGDYHLEEERRLFYVGMTRARDLLFLSASSFYGEGKRERKLSPFIYEALGKEKIEKKLIETPSEKEGQLSILDWNGPSKSEGARLQAKFDRGGSRISYLSYSQIQTFEICPLHYKLKYILKIPTPPSAAQSFGTSVHATLRDFYQTLLRGEKIKIDYALQILRKNWINEGFQSREHEKKLYEKAEEIIANYLKKNFDKTKLPLALELPFEFRISNLRVGGRIDRVDTIPGNKIEIIDYKTGNNMPSDRELLTDTQLTIYALAANLVADKILGRKPEEVLLSLLFLEANKKLTTTRTPEQLETAKKLILEKAEEIARSEFLCSGSNLCSYCEYKILCQARN